MQVEVSDMVKDVRVAIDMNRTPGTLIEEDDLDTLELDEIIESKLCEAIDMVHLEAPLRLLEGKVLFPQNTSQGNLPFLKELDKDGKGRFELPEDFLRLIVFRLTSWYRPVYEAIDETHPLYSLQSSKYKGVYGTKEKPVVAITQRYSVSRRLEVYSGNSYGEGEKVEEGAYVPRAIIDEESNMVEVSKECYKAAVYRAGSLTLKSLGDAQSGVLEEMSRSILNGFV